MPRAYVVMEKAEEAWTEITSVQANDDQHAIRLSTADRNAEGRSGTFVAVPARSFRVRSREIEVKEVDRWT
jgi:hypothetical protein